MKEKKKIKKRKVKSSLLDYLREKESKSLHRDLIFGDYQDEVI